MNVLTTDLPGVLLLTPKVYKDRRGYFMETFNGLHYKKAGVDVAFVQDNLSFSTKGTLRGLHFQYPHPQAKLVQVLQGEVFDVAVDLRAGSDSFGRWFATILSDQNHNQLFIPEGFAHGFCVLSETALFHYKCSDYYHPECEKGIAWNDPDIGIDWPVANPLLSEKDRSFAGLADVGVYKHSDYCRDQRFADGKQ